VYASYSILLERLLQEGAGQRSRLGKGSKRGRGVRCVARGGERQRRHLLSSVFFHDFEKLRGRVQQWVR